MAHSDTHCTIFVCGAVAQGSSLLPRLCVGFPCRTGAPSGTCLPDYEQNFPQLALASMPSCEHVHHLNISRRNTGCCSHDGFVFRLVTSNTVPWPRLTLNPDMQPGLLPLLRGAHLHHPDHRVRRGHFLPHLGGARPHYQVPHRRDLPGAHRALLPRRQPQRPRVQVRIFG